MKSKDYVKSFNEKFYILPDLCWKWIAGHYKNGYGNFRGSKAHRVSWELAHGRIPEGLYVLHKCDVRDCVNPNHLFLGTYKDNMVDMVSKGRHHYKKKTHCKHGHEYTEENTYLVGEWRNCRTCDNKRKNEYYHRNKDKIKLKRISDRQSNKSC